jgi:hypothetical protein
VFDARQRFDCSTFDVFATSMKILTSELGPRAKLPASEAAKSKLGASIPRPQATSPQPAPPPQQPTVPVKSPIQQSQPSPQAVQQQQPQVQPTPQTQIQPPKQLNNVQSLPKQNPTKNSTITKPNIVTTEPPPLTSMSHVCPSNLP